MPFHLGELSKVFPRRFAPLRSESWYGGVVTRRSVFSPNKAFSSSQNEPLMEELFGREIRRFCFRKPSAFS